MGTWRNWYTRTFDMRIKISGTIKLYIRARGGIGIRVRFRSVSRKSWEFESPRAHKIF